MNRRAVVWVTLGNLLPLVLVLTGHLDLPLLLVCYGVEAALLPSDPDLSTRHNWLLRGVAVMLGAILLARALGQVDWGMEALLVLLSTVGLTLAATWQAAREPAQSATPGGLGAVLWRMALVFMGGVVGLSYADDLTVLRDSGWTPEPVGDLVATPFAYRFNQLVAALGLEPVGAAAVVLLVFKTLNEALWTARRSISPATPAPRSTSPTDA